MTARNHFGVLSNKDSKFFYLCFLASTQSSSELFQKTCKIEPSTPKFKKKFYFLCCRSFPSSFFLNMTPLSEVLVHFTSLKAHTSPTCKELSCTNFLQPVEKFVLVAPIMYLIDQVLPSKTERVTLVFLVRKYLSKKWNGTVYI